MMTTLTHSSRSLLTLVCVHVRTFEGIFLLSTSYTSNLTTVHPPKLARHYGIGINTLSPLEWTYEENFGTGNLCQPNPLSYP